MSAGTNVQAEFDVRKLWELSEQCGGEKGRINNAVDCEEDEIQLFALHHPKVLSSLARLYARSLEKKERRDGKDKEIEALEAAIASIENEAAQGDSAADGDNGTSAAAKKAEKVVQLEKARHARQKYHNDLMQMLGIARAYNKLDAAFALVPGSCLKKTDTGGRIVIVTARPSCAADAEVYGKIKECRASEADAEYSVFVATDDVIIVGDCVGCRIKHRTCPARVRKAQPRHILRGAPEALKLMNLSLTVVSENILRLEQKLGSLDRRIRRGDADGALAQSDAIQGLAEVAMAGVELLKAKCEQAKANCKPRGDLDDRAVERELLQLAGVLDNDDSDDENGFVRRLQTLAGDLDKFMRHPKKKSSTKRAGKGRSRQSKNGEESDQLETDDEETAEKHKRRRTEGDREYRPKSKKEVVVVVPRLKEMYPQVGNPEAMKSERSAKSYLAEVRSEIQSSRRWTGAIFPAYKRKYIRQVLERYPQLEDEYFKNVLEQWEKQEKELYGVNEAEKEAEKEKEGGEDTTEAGE